MLNIINAQNINNQNQKIRKDTKESSFRWLRKIKSVHKSKTIRNSEINISTNNFNLDGLGNIELAKLHREANRPLKKIKDFDEKTKFCPCCSLPVRDDEHVKIFNFCENTDKYAECGRGISLYFSFFRFSLFILIITFISICLPTLYLTKIYTDELIDICIKIYNKNGNKIIEKFPECINFIGVKGISEYFISGTGIASIFNSINQKQYRQIYFRNINNYNNIDKVLVNYSIIYFVNLLAFFIINLLYILLLYTQNKQYDLSITSPSDFTVIIGNLNSSFKIFMKKINNKNIENNDELGSSSQINQIINNNEKNKELKSKSELGLIDSPSIKENNIQENFSNFIKDKICENSDGKKFNVKKVNICYKINEFMKIEEKIQDIKAKIIKTEHDPKQIAKNEKYNLIKDIKKYFYNPLNFFDINLFNCQSCEKSILLTELESEQLKLENDLKDSLKQVDNLTKENFSGVVFVTFNTMDEQEEFLKRYPKSFIGSLIISLKNLKYFCCCCLIIKNSKKRYILQKDIEVDEAPEPEDIIFENLHFSSKERFCRIFLIYFLSMIIIGICLTIILGLNYVQIKYQQASDNNRIFITYLVSFIITGVTFLLNSIFQISLGYLTRIEKQISMTNYYLSFSIKLTFFSFMTSGIVPLLSNYYYDQNSNYNLLLANMFTMFLINSFLTPIMWTFDFKFLLKKYNINKIEKNGNSDLTQRELNSLYEFPDMKISYKYSYIAKTLLLSFFYLPIFPFGVLISLLGFIFGYFLEKYNFSHRYKRPEMLNSKICEFYSNYFIVNFIVLGIGNYIFLFDNYKNKIWAIFNIFLFLFLLLIPFNQISRIDFIGVKESQIKSDVNFDNSFFKFCNDYERANPMTKKEGMKNFLNKLKENGLINEIDHNSIFNNIDNINLMETYCKTRKNFNNYLIQMALVSIINKENLNLDNNEINEDSQNQKNLINYNETKSNIENNNIENSESKSNSDSIEVNDKKSNSIENSESKSNSDSVEVNDKKNNNNKINLDLNLNVIKEKDSERSSSSYNYSDSKSEQNSNIGMNNVDKALIQIDKENNINNLLNNNKKISQNTLNRGGTRADINRRRKSIFCYNNQQRKMLHRYSNPFIFGIQMNYDNINSNLESNNIIKNNDDNSKIGKEDEKKNQINLGFSQIIKINK